MCFAVAAMFIFVSVFAGLEDLNRSMISNLHADITITPSKGKTLADIDQVVAKLKSNKEVADFSKLIEEKVYINYNNKGEIAYLRGVDSAYTKVNPINETIFYGTYPSFQYSNEVLMENQLNVRLGVPVGSETEVASVFMPKPGTGIISKEEDIFNKKAIYVTGVFPSKDQMDGYIISPIELTRQLLGLKAGTAYSIVIKLKNGNNASAVKDDLVNALGNSYVLKTKEEENAAFWKMINTEKVFIYLIFALVIFITTFNLAGAIIILQLDKKDQAKALVSIGLRMSELRRVYFYTGLLIVIAGIIAGLLVGTLVCYLQIFTGVFKVSGSLPFPVHVLPMNYVYVVLTAAIFGITVSWFASKVKKQYLTKN